MIDAAADLFIEDKTHADGPWRISGTSPRDGPALMMTATPDLSSAPSSVVPSVVTRVLPNRRLQLGVIGDANHLARIAREGRYPGHCNCDAPLAGRRGRWFPARYRSCAIQAMAGQSCGCVEGKLAMTMPCSSCAASRTPMLRNSSPAIAPAPGWPGLLG